MSVGSWRHRIVIQQQAGTTQDEFGHTVESWTTFLEADAFVDRIGGFERFASMQTNSTADTKVIMRYRDGIDTKKRIKFGTRIFDIESIRNFEERNRMLELRCKEAVE